MPIAHTTEKERETDLPVTGSRETPRDESEKTSFAGTRQPTPPAHSGGDHSVANGSLSDLSGKADAKNSSGTPPTGKVSRVKQKFRGNSPRLQEPLPAAARKTPIKPNAPTAGGGGGSMSHQSGSSRLKNGGASTSAKAPPAFMNNQEEILKFIQEFHSNKLRHVIDFPETLMPPPQAGNAPGGVGGAEIKTPLSVMQAALLGNAAKIEELVKGGALAHERGECATLQKGKFKAALRTTPLGAASLMLSVESVRCLLKHGADCSALSEVRVQQKGENVRVFKPLMGLTPLHLACIKQSGMQISPSLPQQRTSPSYPTSIGRKFGKDGTLEETTSEAQEAAEDSVAVEVARLLLDSADSADAAEGGGPPAAAGSRRVTCSNPSSGDSASCPAVAGRDELLRARDQFGNTVLHLAASSGRTALVTYLLEQGADPDSRNKDGHSPLHAARQAGRTDCAGELEKRMKCGGAECEEKERSLLADEEKEWEQMKRRQIKKREKKEKRKRKERTRAAGEVDPAPNDEVEDDGERFAENNCEASAQSADESTNFGSEKVATADPSVPAATTTDAAPSVAPPVVPQPQSPPAQTSPPLPPPAPISLIPPPRPPTVDCGGEGGSDAGGGEEKVPKDRPPLEKHGQSPRASAEAPELSNARGEDNVASAGAAPPSSTVAGGDEGGGGGSCLGQVAEKGNRERPSGTKGQAQPQSKGAKNPPSSNAAPMDAAAQAANTIKKLEQSLRKAQSEWSREKERRVAATAEAAQHRTESLQQSRRMEKLSRELNESRLREERTARLLEEAQSREQESKREVPVERGGSEREMEAKVRRLEEDGRVLALQVEDTESRMMSLRYTLEEALEAKADVERRCRELEDELRAVREEEDRWARGDHTSAPDEMGGSSEMARTVKAMAQTEMRELVAFCNSQLAEKQLEFDQTLKDCLGAVLGESSDAVEDAPSSVLRMRVDTMSRWIGTMMEELQNRELKERGDWSVDESLGEDVYE